MKDKKFIGVKLEQELYENVQAQAQKNFCNVTSFIKMALLEKLRKDGGGVGNGE